MSNGLTLGPATRDAYGEALLALGYAHDDVVVIDADLSKSTKTFKFGQAFPRRFFNVGIAEANAVSVAVGLAAGGMVPFVSSFAVFLMTKGLDQLRMGVAYSQHNVKIVTSHGGITVGEDGPSQHSVEDIALALTLPGVKVIVPSDAHAARALTRELYQHDGPVYMRTGRPKAPVLYNEDTPFAIGKWHLLAEGRDVAILACGQLVGEALKARDLLSEVGVSAAVIDAYSVRPMDLPLLDRAIAVGALVVAEEHLMSGGLGSEVCRAVCQRGPVPVECVGLDETYAESGTAEELLERYQLSAGAIAIAARRAVARKPSSAVAGPSNGNGVYPLSNPFGGSHQTHL